MLLHIFSKHNEVKRKVQGLPQPDSDLDQVDALTTEFLYKKIQLNILILIKKTTTHHSNTNKKPNSTFYCLFCAIASVRFELV